MKHEPPEPEPTPALDPHHPIVFRRAFVRRAGRIQWALILVGGLVLLGAGIAVLAHLYVWGSIGIAGYPAAGGALLFLCGVIWGRLWRRRFRRAWWGKLYGRWW